MVTYLIQLFVGVIGGMAASFQASFVGLIEEKFSTLTSVFITYVGGGALMTIIFFGSGGRLPEWRAVPWYTYLAGPLGLVIIASLSFTVPRMGAATATTLFVTAWLILNAISDHFGWFGVVQPLQLTRLAGIAALLVGTYLMVRPSS